MQGYHGFTVVCIGAKISDPEFRQCNVFLSFPGPDILGSIPILFLSKQCNVFLSRCGHEKDAPQYQNQSHPGDQAAYPRPERRHTDSFPVSRLLKISLALEWECFPIKSNEMGTSTILHCQKMGQLSNQWESWLFLSAVN